MSLKDQVSSALKWSAIGKLGGQLFSWITTLLVMRLLSPDDYGLLAISTIFTALLITLSDAGMQAAIIRKDQITTRYLRQVFGVNCGIYFLVALTICLMAHPVALYYDDPRITPIMLVLGLNSFLPVFSKIPTSLLLKDMNFKPLALINLSVMVISSLVSLALAYMGFGVWALVLGQVTSTLVIIVGNNIVRPFMHMPLFQFNEVLSDLKYGGIITLQRIVWWVFNSFDRLLLGKLLDMTQLGYFTVGSHLASLPRDKISQTINQVVFPAISKIKHDPQTVKADLSKALNIMALLILPVFFGMSSIAQEIIDAILGEKWHGALIPLLLIPLAMPFRMFSIPLGETLNAMGYPRKVLIFQLFSLSTILSSLSLGGYYGGITGVSLAWCIVAPVNVLYLVHLGKPVFLIGSRDFIKLINQPLLGSIVMYLCVWLTRKGLTHVRTQTTWLENVVPAYVFDIGQMIALIIIGAAAYIFYNYAFNRKSIDNTLHLFRKSKT